MTNDELKARKAGWFPTVNAHTMFKDGNPDGVCRDLRPGETYEPETDSYMSTPLRHADNWQHACERDGLK